MFLDGSVHDLESGEVERLETIQFLGEYREGRRVVELRQCQIRELVISFLCRVGIYGQVELEYRLEDVIPIIVIV